MEKVRAALFNSQTLWRGNVGLDFVLPRLLLAELPAKSIRLPCNAASALRRIRVQALADHQDRLGDARFYALAEKT